MAGVNKTHLTETDIITKYILPAVKDAGWDVMSQIRQEVKLRDGKVVVRGKLAARLTVKSADIVLYHKPGLPLAVIEAKANKHEVGKGMQQGLDYARLPPTAMALSFTIKPATLFSLNLRSSWKISQLLSTCGIDTVSGKGLPPNRCPS